MDREVAPTDRADMMACVLVFRLEGKSSGNYIVSQTRRRKMVFGVFCLSKTFPEGNLLEGSQYVCSTVHILGYTSTRIDKVGILIFSMSNGKTTYNTRKGENGCSIG
mmetsp:Transcript_37156/g.54669  ORF Transcript_37156/g.54669 Transcript_37156/m.54669 type:complete len:107 (-) Transcript_37156:220-540(-)